MARRTVGSGIFRRTSFSADMFNLLRANDLTYVLEK
jgi:hypothetical protein